jgi:hypothetical protein
MGLPVQWYPRGNRQRLPCILANPVWNSTIKLRVSLDTGLLPWLSYVQISGAPYSC